MEGKMGVKKKRFVPLCVKFEGVRYQIVAPVQSHSAIVDYILENRGAIREERALLNWMDSQNINYKFLDIGSKSASRRCFAIYVDDRNAVLSKMERIFKHRLR